MIVIGVMAKNNKKTTISLSEETKEQLAKFENKKGESYDEILQRVMRNTSTLCNKKTDDGIVDGGEED